MHLVLPVDKTKKTLGSSSLFSPTRNWYTLTRCWCGSSKCSSGCRCASLLWGCSSGSRSVWCPPDLQGLFCKAAFQLVDSQPVPMHRLISRWVQDFALHFISLNFCFLIYLLMKMDIGSCIDPWVACTVSYCPPAGLGRSSSAGFFQFRSSVLRLRKLKRLFSRSSRTNFILDNCSGFFCNYTSWSNGKRNSATLGLPVVLRPL